MMYEIMYIVPSKFSDSEVGGVMKTVNGLITKHNGSVVKSEQLGKLKFAYPIKRFTHGSYVLMYVEAEGTAVKDIDLELRLSNEVLRHVIVKREKGIPTFEYKLSAYVSPITPEGKRVTQSGEVVKGSKTVVSIQEEEDESVASSETVDEKLDEILDGDTLSTES